jgi:hypothetical protein
MSAKEFDSNAQVHHITIGKRAARHSGAPTQHELAVPWAVMSQASSLSFFSTTVAHSRSYPPFFFKRWLFFGVIGKIEGFFYNPAAPCRPTSTTAVARIDKHWIVR